MVYVGDIWTYLLTPKLRSFVNQSNKKIVLYSILLLVVFQFPYPLVELIVNAAGGDFSLYKYCFDNLGLKFGGGLIAYYLAGWYLNNHEFGKKQENALFILGIVGVLLTFLLTQIIQTGYYQTYSNESILVFLYSIAVFVFAKRFFKPGEKSKEVIYGLSKLTFGVYVVHVFVLYTVMQCLPNEVAFMPVIFFITLLLCFVISFAISKIPFFRRFIKA